MRLAKQTILMMAEEAARHPEDEERRKRVHYFLTCESTAKLRAMVENVRSEQDIAIKPQAFNTDPFLLCVDNGTLNLRTGVLQRHNADDLITLMAPVAYDPDAMHADWEEVLDRFVRADPGKEEFLQRAAFASLTGDTSDKAFMNPYDENVGNTGKTTFIESLLATLGPHGATVNAEAFLARRSGGGMRADLATCDGKLMVVSSELGSWRAPQHWPDEEAGGRLGRVPVRAQV